MKILHYCQHVLGMGHFFRTLEILRAFDGHAVLLVSGGSPVDVPLPAHVQLLQLPALRMDAEFGGLISGVDGQSVERVKEQRRHMLFDAFARWAPALFMVELYPFGRRKFSFEINPLLTGIRQGRLPSSFVACSLRDILVERDRPLKYENGVLEVLNGYFDAVTVHADPALVRLEETFARAGQIRPPVVYTGFVAQKPPPDGGRRLRRRLGLQPDQPLLVASAGGGQVGAPLLQAVVEAFSRCGAFCNGRLEVFAGPFLSDADYNRLQSMASERIGVSRFTPHFLAYLAAADLSVSMAGYNTCMNILATRVPALVWPFAQNREQRLRVERLARYGRLAVLEDTDLPPERLAHRMAAALQDRRRPSGGIDLDGARKTADWLIRQVGAARGEP